MPYSYNGCAASRNPGTIGVDTVWEPIRGIRFPGGVKAGDVETVMTYLVRQLDVRVEPVELYKSGDEWGWAYRANVNNPNTLSCHASATAIDYNATRHPNRVKYTWTRAQVREIHQILDELQGVVRWLEGFDEMHFEIRGSVAEVAKVAKKIRDSGGAAPTPTPPTTPIGEPLVYRIYWYKSGSGPSAAYRVLAAKCEKKVPVGFLEYDAVWIENLDQLKVWRSRGLLEANTGVTPAVPRGSIAFHGGPYDNTKVV